MLLIKERIYFRRANSFQLVEKKDEKEKSNCLKITQWAFGAKMMSYRHRCDVITSTFPLGMHVGASIRNSLNNVQKM